MFKRLKFALGAQSTNRAAFIIGAGRSGTHWLGYTLAAHPQIRATIEPQPLFNYATQMALDPELEPQLMPKLIQGYRWQLYKSSPKMYVEKTHPNIWHAEKLKAAFPNAFFVNIERNPYATVASMIVHNNGLSKWQWDKYPLPNRFLGISEEQAKYYEDIPFAAQCAMRWQSHHDRAEHLRDVLKDDLFCITYREFADNTVEVLKRIQDFLGLSEAFPAPEVRRESLHKWQRQLSAEQLKQIEEVVGMPPPSA